MMMMMYLPLRPVYTCAYVFVGAALKLDELPLDAVLETCSKSCLMLLQHIPNILVTLGKHGVVLARRGDVGLTFPTRRFPSVSTFIKWLNTNSNSATVLFHPWCRHNIQRTAAVLYLTSSGRSARSSLYNRQAGVSSLWCHRLELPASPRRVCAVIRGFQTTTQGLSVFPFLPRRYHMIHVTIRHYCLDICGPCNN